MLGFALVSGAKIGYYQGDPLKLVEDCGILKPTVFPSVPRLYNRIYGVIKGKFAAVTGVKAMLINKGTVGGISYSIHVLSLVATVSGLLFYLYYLLKQSDKGLKSMIQHIYGKK